MRKQTTTKQLQQAITNNLLHIALAQKYNKSTHKTDAISPETFQESLDFLCESLFWDCIGWHYERNHETGNYEVDCGRMNPDIDVVVIAHLCANEGVDRECIEIALRMMEED